MRPSKKAKAVTRRDDSLDFGLVVKTIVGTLALSFATVWFGRQAIWLNEDHLQCMDTLSKSKILLRVQSDLLDEALHDVAGMRDSLVLKSAELRAMSARELFTSERDRAAFDDFLLSLGRDINEINGNAELKMPLCWDLNSLKAKLSLFPSALLNSHSKMSKRKRGRPPLPRLRLSQCKL
jgi:hypothetical protein